MLVHISVGPMFCFEKITFKAHRFWVETFWVSTELFQ